MSKGKLQIHSENILPIIKKWLYSDKDIFIRELVSNSCDAIQKMKLLRDQGKTDAKDEEFRIDIKVDKKERTLTVLDTGIGMDAGEVENYIAQIAFSGAEDFVEKYKSNQEKDQFIGHFGLGFYSAYMVAEKVTIDTLSYKEGAKPAYWVCDGSPEYELKKGKREERGTTITLHIDQESDDYLDEANIKKILSHYCSFLPYPVYLNDQRINEKEPLWIKAPSECTEKDYLEFYRHLYPLEDEPLFWVHLNVDYPFHLKGILYFPKLRHDPESRKGTIKLFCNRVFVSDNCKDIIPEYLMMLRGVIDSPDIPLNVSRSYLQMDRTVRQLGSHISKKVSDSLSTLRKTDHQRFEKVWKDIGSIIKLGAVQDDKFYERVQELILWKTTEGEWTNAKDYLENNKTDQSIFYTTDSKHHPHVLDIYKNKGIDVLIADQLIDSYVMPKLEEKLSAKFKRLDAALEEHIIDKDKEKNILDQEGKTEAGRLADFIRGKLEAENVDVQAKSLATGALPGFVVIDEEQRRMRDYMLQMGPEATTSMMKAQKKTFVVNTNNEMITALQKLDAINPELTKDMVQEVYELALVSQKELDPGVFHDFLNRTNHLLEKLVAMAVSAK